MTDNIPTELTTKLETAIRAARAAGAYSDTIADLEALDGAGVTLGDILENERGANAALRYARDIIKGRWPEAEAVIAQDADAASWYARDIIKGRWPEAEAVIAQNADAASWYASDIIKGRWPEAEAVIAQNAKAAYWYAEEVIKGPWPEAGIC